MRKAAIQSQAIPRSRYRNRNDNRSRAAPTIKTGSRVYDICVYFLAGALCFITLYPMYYVLILSLSSPESVVLKSVYFWPKGIYLGSYGIIVNDSRMWNAYLYTIVYVVSGTILMLMTSVSAAYPLTVKNLIGRKYVVTFLIIPMYFSGGLIPTYLLMTRLGLYNNIWAIIVPSAFGIWNIILMRTYFNSLPDSLRESAFIDGASHARIILSIYIPLSKPIMAVISIYTIVGIWNSWFNAMVYLPNADIQPLQMYLRRVLVEQTVDLTKIVTAEEMETAVRRMRNALQLRYSMIVFCTLPVLLTYPFFQKHFVKGVMLGSLKG